MDAVALPARQGPQQERSMLGPCQAWFLIASLLELPDNILD